MLMRRGLALLERLEFDTPFRVIFPNGREAVYGQSEPVFTIHFKTRRSLRQTFTKSMLGWGEAYMSGEIDIEGGMDHVVRLGFTLQNSIMPMTAMHKLKYALDVLTRRNTYSGSKRNIAAHYDLSNEFYRLWLDGDMQYTCGYFRSADDSLEQAQLSKMDLVCRKLQLKPGDLVVEAGCGWGGLALHMVREYGVRVRAYNISEQQVAYARARQRRYGIGENRLEYVLDDYRNIPETADRCDKFVSICMIEHAGRGNYATFHDVVARVLKPGGLAVIQFISRRKPAKHAHKWLEKHVFPGYYNPTLSEFIAPLEAEGSPLHPTDVENMRYHYALTVKHWWDRLEANAGRIRELYGERRGEEIIRKFRIYLAGGYADFGHGMGTLIYQLVLSNGADNAAPLTRDHLFADEALERKPVVTPTAAE